MGKKFKRVFGLGNQSSKMNKFYLHCSRQITDHYELIKNFFLVSFFMLLGKIIGGAKEVAVAWRYGVSPMVDVYVLIFNIINWPGVILGGVLMTAVIPLGAPLYRRSPQKGLLFFSEVFGWVLFWAIILLGGVYALLSFVIGHGFLGLDSMQARLADDMYVPLLSTLFFNCLIAFFSPLILIAGRHWNTLAEIIPSICIFLALIFSNIFFNPLLWGTVVGFFLQCIFLIFCLFSLDIPLRPSWAFSSPEWVNFSRVLFPLAAIQALTIFPGIIDQVWAARLETGSVSIFNYANRLFSLLSSFAMIVIARSMLPLLSMQARSSFVLRLTIQWMVIVFILGALLGSLCALFLDDIVKIFFERGAFTVADTKYVGRVFFYSLWSIPFYFSFFLGLQLFFSTRRYCIIIFIYFIMILVKFVGNFFLIRIYAVSAFMLTSTLMYALGLILIIASLVTIRNGREEARLFWTENDRS